MDERLKKLSDTIVNYSIKVKEDDRVLIQYENDKCKSLVNHTIPFTSRIKCSNSNTL